METFTMSRKELARAGLVKAALSGRITNRRGAAALQLTIRQFQRLKRRVETGGAPALRHRSRGQPSPRRLPGKLRARRPVAPALRVKWCRDLCRGDKASLSRSSGRKSIVVGL